MGAGGRDLKTRTHIVRLGESLVQIAHYYYGSLADEYLTSLYEANHDLIVKEPNYLRPGIILVIPEMEKNPNAPSNKKNDE